MSDIVGQLRDLQTNGDAWGLLDLTPAVITEIERLRGQLEAAQAALVRQAGIMHRFGDKPDAAT